MARINRTEARSTLLATGILLLGVAARAGFGPGPAEVGWSSDSTGTADRPPGVDSIRARVEAELRAEAAAERPLAPGETLDPNSASLTELRRLPGIGRAKAAAIVAEREANGPYRELSDLLRVAGIGPSTVSRIAGFVTLPGREMTSERPHSSRLSGPELRPVDVNRAQIKELEQITGIGPALALRIVDTRRRVGPFRKAEDLLLVPGIGPAVLQAIRGQVRF